MGCALMWDFGLVLFRSKIVLIRVTNYKDVTAPAYVG